MKATLEFDLSDPDEKMEHLRCIKSLDMALAMWDIMQYDITVEDKHWIFEILENRNINIDELII